MRSKGSDIGGGGDRSGEDGLAVASLALVLGSIVGPLVLLLAGCGSRSRYE